MEQFCKYHPDRKSRKKCHHCSEYVCSECQLDFLGTSFCSVPCLLKSFGKAILSLVNIKPKTVTERRASIIPRIKIKSFGPIFNLLLLILFIFLWFSINNLSREIRLLGSLQPNNTPAEFKAVDLNGKSPSVITSPDAMVTTNNITITGEAADSVILSLKVNGRLQAVTIPTENKFTFDNIELSYGDNEIIVYGMDTNGSSSIIQKISTYYGKPRMDFLARDITRGNPKVNKIALTFDGGAGNGATDQILDFLKENKVKCTMFLTGAFLKNYPEYAKRIVKDGHEVGNHTWSHPHLTTLAKNSKQETIQGISQKDLQKELTKTAELFKKTTGKEMQLLWRAPYGEENSEIRQWAAELGYRHIGWTIQNGMNLDSHDWVVDSTTALYKTPDKVLEKLLNFGSNSPSKANGGIILMHLDTQRKQNQVHFIIPALIDSLRNRGYELVTISELLKQ